MYSLNLDTDNRVLSACVCLDGFEYTNIVDTLPDGNITDYKYINGEYVLDPIPEPEPPTPEPTEFDVLEAQVIYTAVMTDTLIEEV